MVSISEARGRTASGRTAGLLAAAVLLVVAALLALTVGRIPVGFGDVVRVAFASVTGGSAAVDLLVEIPLPAQGGEVRLGGRPLASLGRREVAAAGMAGLLSTHDPNHALLLADRVALVDGGRVVGPAATAETVTAEALWGLYGVQVDVVAAPGAAVPVIRPSLPG